MHEYYVFNAMHCIWGAPMSMLGGGEPPSEGPASMDPTYFDKFSRKVSETSKHSRTRNFLIDRSPD